MVLSKKIHILYLVWLIALSLLFFVVVSAKTITVATSEWIPYTSEMMESGGFATEIVVAAFKEVNYEVKVIFCPWKRCEDALIKGSVDAIYPYVQSSERLSLYFFSENIYSSKGTFFCLESRFSEFSWNSLSDFSNYVIGGVLGFWYEKEFEKYNLKVDYTTTSESNFRKMLAQRVDFVIEDELVGRYILKNMPEAKNTSIKIVKKPLNISELHLMVSKNSPNRDEIVSKFNKGLKIIKKNGTYNNILEKYGLSKD